MAAIETNLRDGESMVKRHHDKLQAEKEAAGIAKLQSSLPKLAKPILAFALQDSQLDADKALLVLRQFQSEAFDELNDIHRRRKHLRSRANESTKAPISKRSVSASSGSGSEPDSSDERRRRHDKSRKHKHKKSSKHSSEKRQKHRHKKDKNKKDKRSKRERHSPLAGSHDDHPSKPGSKLEFGSFGIIRESDYAVKRPEFAAWASEVKRIDIESLPRGDERDLFREFLEDFNTCTLPHRKYYDLASYARTHGDGDTAGGGRGGDAGVDDERQRRLELQAERKAREDAAARQLLSRMVMSDAQMSELKQREMMRLRAQDAYKTGDMGTANRLMKQLRPAEEGGAHNEGGEY